MDEISFTSGRDRCAAWHFDANGDAFAGARGVPCVVMAPGFAGTRDTSALMDYARGFAAAGLDVVLFDYRGFGGSGGSPRQLVSAPRQRRDYRAAIAAARQLPGVDPERIVLWGISYSGGHVVRVAAEDGRVAAVVALTPAIDGVAVLAQLARTVGTRQLLRAAAHGMRDAQRAMTRRRPHLVPMVGEPGSRAIFAMDGAEQAYTEVAGPTWRNEVCARTALEVAFNRPIRFAPRVRCPLLVQAGTADRVAPLATARRAAARAGVRAELREYPIDHVDVYTQPAHQRLLDDQLDFLGRHLSPTARERHQGGTHHETTQYPHDRNQRHKTEGGRGRQRPVTASAARLSAMRIPVAEPDRRLGRRRLSGCRSRSTRLWRQRQTGRSSGVRHGHAVCRCGRHRRRTGT